MAPTHAATITFPAKIDPDIFLICAWKRGTMGWESMEAYKHAYHEVEHHVFGMAA